MDVVNESSAAPKLRRAPFVVRLAPELLSRMAASIPENEHGSKDEMNGLLFGLAEAEFVLVQVFRPFSSQPGRTDRPGTKRSLQQSFDALIATCQSDPELAGLKLLGWFSAPISGGLAEEGIAFHEENFSNINDLALIVRNEPAGYLSLELYCRSLDGSFSTGQNRWGVVRISTASPVASPLEVPMRTKIHDDLYMRAYQFSDRDEDDEPVSGWKSVLAARAKKAFGRVKPFKPENKNESAISKRKPEKSATDNSQGVTSMSQALQYASRGGAAPAPAKTREEPAESSESIAERRGGVRRTDREEPPTVTSRQQPAPATPSEEVPPVRGENPAAAAIPNEPRSQAMPSYSPPVSQVLGLHSLPTPPVMAQPASIAVLAPLPAQTERRLPWLALAAVFAVSTGGTFGFIYLKDARANASLPGVVQAVWPSKGLHLNVSKSGERVQLSWNRAIPATRNAQDGLLEINDGPGHRQIRLTAGEVANGSILYLPNTNDLVFRLEVHGAAGQNVSESMRVLGTSKSAKVGATQPQKRPADKPNVHPASSNPGSAAAQVQQGGTRSVDPARLAPVDPRDREAPKADLQSKDQLPIEKRTVVPPASAPSTTNPRRGITAQTAGNSTKQAPDRRPAPFNAAAANGDGTNSLPASAPAGQSARFPDPAQKSSRPTDPLLAYQPPRPIRQVLPKVSALPADAGDAAGEVRVIVRVNESGQVVDAQLVETDDKVGPALRAAALSAAREWVFAPASQNGKNVASNHTILFHFRH